MPQYDTNDPERWRLIPDTKPTAAQYPFTQGYIPVGQTWLKPEDIQIPAAAGAGGFTAWLKAHQAEVFMGAVGFALLAVVFGGKR
ncbi:MAG: hypothetical protein IT160_07075 [Bryobacterales bacterium]|nr:hypothetical protein [Bryobacterales bacterium]